MYPFVVHVPYISRIALKLAHSFDRRHPFPLPETAYIKLAVYSFIPNVSSELERCQ